MAIPESINRAGRYLAGGCVIAFSALGILGVVARSFPVLSIQVSWIDELTRLMLVWMVFLGCALVSAGTAHFGIVIFVDMAGRQSRMWLQTLADLLVAGFLALLVWQSVVYALSQMRQRTTILELPVSLFPLAIAVGSALMLAFTLCSVVRRHSGSRG